MLVCVSVCVHADLCVCLRCVGLIFLVCFVLGLSCYVLRVLYWIAFLPD